MIIIIAGGTHTGKTVLAQKFLEKYHYPYLSIDHLKMGLIRSGYCSLTPESDVSALTDYLWPIVREMVKTAIENKQNLIIEGSYVPLNYKTDFQADYLQKIRFVCLILSEKYIQTHYAEIIAHSCAIEYRMAGTALSKEELMDENRKNLSQCKDYGLDYVLIDGRYVIAWDIMPQFIIYSTRKSLLRFIFVYWLLIVLYDAVLLVYPLF